MKLNHRISATVLAAVTVVAVTSCASTGPSSDPSASGGPSASGVSATSQSSASAGASVDASAEASGSSTPGSAETQAVVAAVKAAEDHVGGKAYSIEKDDERWDIYVANGDRSVEVEIRADGSVGDTEQDDLDGRDRDALAKATVTLSDALTQALEKGGTLDEADIDMNGDNVQWQIEIDMDGNSSTVNVPAM